MKNLLLIVLIISFFGNVFGQVTEYGVRLNSGFFSFSGNSAESEEAINYNLDREDGYTNNPYGTKSGLSYGLSANISRTTKSNIKFGIDLGYELLKSKIDIVRVWQHGDLINESVVAKGQTYLNFSFINLFPSLGYRYSISEFDIDIEGGVEFAKCLSATEDGYAESNTREYETVRDRKTIDSETRVRIQILISKNKLGGYVGYSKGLKNYLSGSVGGAPEAFGNMIRFGIIYNLK